MGAIQPWHLVILLVIVLLVLGPGKLPDVGRAMGQTIREFRDATKSPEDRAGVRRAPQQEDTTGGGSAAPRA